jgi:2-polyprenyl-3-methyl-5-hydroxy-6-metoxy-1,4-benzoquinol methylase
MHTLLYIAIVSTATSLTQQFSAKQTLLGILSPPAESIEDNVLRDPSTKFPLTFLTRSNPSYANIKFVKQRRQKQLSKTTTSTISSYINLLPSNNNNNNNNNYNGAISPFDKDYDNRQDLFTNPLVSFLYERGWREGFVAAGFPGEYSEWLLATGFFANKADVLVDMSCGTGMFTRRFYRSNNYKRVIAADYSDSMLRETRRRLDIEVNDNNQVKTEIDLVRLDVGEIPFFNSR